ncbi:uncharacterized protein BYT42DRAFT_123247 [Radiomyces spectabilis]|uniref:uncharacterized protein n=1 Tax=Radiomyces spectabilis TaxID=64574 RepID=UPI002220D5F1|nr:uncharacterized protein BYT42DRAFT_123247 [Radiomyces spectabilis]KAI8368230.1 hypothetical protein BYT42DRAFT_123247 [Radiomyces spectabilis]
MSRLHKFLSAVLRQQKMFHETMLWFLSVIQRFSNSPDTQPSADTPVITDHPRYAVEYLKTCFTKDSLNHFIQTETIPEGEERSIPTLRSMLQTSTDTCHGLLHQPSRVISENTKVSQQWVLFSSKDGISITHCKLGRLMASHIVQTLKAIATMRYCNRKKMKDRQFFFCEMLSRSIRYHTSIIVAWILVTQPLRIWNSLTTPILAW